MRRVATFLSERSALYRDLLVLILVLVTSAWNAPPSIARGDSRFPDSTMSGPDPQTPYPPNTPRSIETSRATPVSPTATVSATPVDLEETDCPRNWLRNGNFEGEFIKHELGRVVVAEGWTPWFRKRPGTGGYNHIPVHGPQDAFISGMERIYEGRFAQKWSTTGATHTAGIYQQVDSVPQHSRVRFSVWVQVRSGDRNDVDKAQISGNYQVSIGIDPFGGQDHNSEHIIWSPADVFAYNAFRQLHVETLKPLLATT